MSRSTPWLALLEASGNDRVSFLQGQLTQDLTLLSPSRPVVFAASCDARGRVLATLTLILTGERLLIAIRHEIAEAWLAQVLKYRLRAKVNIEAVDDLRLIATHPTGDEMHTWSPLAQGATAVSAPPQPVWRIGGLLEHVVEAGEAASAVSDDDWRRGRLDAGLLDIGEAALAAYTPHMLNLDRVGAISFSKGCYTGQEVVARTEHLGAVKRRATRVRATRPLAVGEAVMAANRRLGRIALAVGSDGAAVLPVDLDGAALALEDGSPVEALV